MTSQQIWNEGKVTLHPTILTELILFYCNYRTIHVPYKTALLRWNWHTITCTYLKPTVWWVMTHLCIHESITIMKIMNILITLQSFFVHLGNPSLLPQATYSPIPSPPVFPRQLLICFFSLYIHLNYPEFYVNRSHSICSFSSVFFHSVQLFWDSSMLLSISIIHFFS